MVYMPETIIDPHIHLSKGGEILDKFIAAYKKYTVERIWMFGKKGKHEELFREAKRHPDFIRPFPNFDPDQEQPEIVDELRRDGAWGLKFICPLKNYDDEAYMKIYERMAAHKMAAYFHTGIIGGDRDKPAPGVSTARMMPVFLDTIVRSFRELTVIGAHLGNPWFEVAIEIMRYSSNLYFDLCGSTIQKKMTPEWMHRILHDEKLWSQMMFASDLSDNVATWDDMDLNLEYYVNSHRSFVTSYRLPKELWPPYFRENALRIETLIAPK
ncbi:MAG TPA: hypothetical protein ENN09_07240 [Planctomycetes bacterium]|mgnify:CR=1 FL=1|nr:hypothetical protein [Planctomycetota bacterium]